MILTIEGLRMRSDFQDLTGQRFDRLIVVGLSEKTGGTDARWACRCDCGNIKTIAGGPLKSRRTRSCGCLNDEARRRKRVTPEHIQERRKKNWDDWYARNRDRQVAKAAAWQQANSDQKRANVRRRTAERMADPIFRLTRNLRSRLLIALKTGAKTGSAVADLGCSVEELKGHLEAQFYDRADGTAMSWDNYGKDGWNIDHIQPLLLLSQGKDVATLCHYTNLQPLWREDNLSKRRHDLQALGLVA